MKIFLVVFVKITQMNKQTKNLTSKLKKKNIIKKTKELLLSLLFSLSLSLTTTKTKTTTTTITETHIFFHF